MPGPLAIIILFSVGANARHCDNNCDCKGYEYCLDEEMPFCRLRRMGELLAGEKHCACESCEDNSSNGDSSDSGAGDRREFLWSSSRKNLSLLHANNKSIHAVWSSFRSLQSFIS